MSERADKLVGWLLEDEIMDDDLQRVCAQCEKESGPVTTTGRKSHGLCSRHWAIAAKEAGFTPEQIEQRLGNKEKAFPPDTSFTHKQPAAPPKASFYPSMGGPSNA